MSNGNSGGAANELGSLHRSGAAAFLAIHAMVGRPVEGRIGAIPHRIFLEASEAVDDIVVEMIDGSKWFLQCKRNVGLDSAFIATATQWSRQNYRPGDGLGLVAREFKGALRDIQRTIDQLNDARAPELNVKQQENVSKVRLRLEDAGFSDSEQVLRDALFLQVATEGAADPQYAVATALLDRILLAGQSDAAFVALRDWMQVSAANKRWSNIEDWLDVLTSAGFVVRSDISGVPAARDQAKREAIQAHRQRLARARNVLSLSMLAPVLGDVHVADLLKGWKVEWAEGHRSAELTEIARRNSRFLLTGLPGLGKSEALRQLAAWLASNDEAPVPVLIDLKHSLSDMNLGRPLTLDGLLRQVSEFIVGVDTAVTTEALREALLSGNALLLVDGLDEAGSKRGEVAADLSRILQDLPGTTGFILSTRPSAQDAAAQLRLPTVELQSPKSLERSSRAIVEAFARESGIGHEEWIEERMTHVSATSQRVEAIWKVPLLATLATIQLAKYGTEAENSVELLSDVIDSSITAWEQLKVNHSDGLDREMRSEILADGFVTIGCLINSPPATVADAEAAVEHQIERWGFADAVKEKMAREVVHFWDERVGVFVKNGDSLVARSRQFAELADARRATRLPATEKQTWITEALKEPDLRTTVQLAVQYDDGIRFELLDAADRNAPEENRARAVQWIIAFAPNWQHVPIDMEERIIDLIADAAEDRLPVPAPGTSLIEQMARSKHDDDGWYFAVRLLRLEPSHTLRHLRLKRLNKLSVTPEQRELIHLHQALTDAEQQNRPLAQQDLDQVFVFLNRPKPPESTSDYRKGVLMFIGAGRYIEGVADVVEMVVSHVPHLPDGSADHLMDIAKRLSGTTLEKVTSTLRKQGHDIDTTQRWAATEGLRSVAELFAVNNGLGWLLSILADWPASDIPVSLPEAWRWKEISDLISIIRWGQGRISDTKYLLETPPELQKIWIETVVDAYGLDRDVLSAQARKILGEGNDEHLSQICTPSLTSHTPIRPLTCKEAARLAKCFASKSLNITTIAAELTINTGCTDVSKVIESLNVPMSWQNRFISTAVSIATAASRAKLIEQYRQSESPQRSAVAYITHQQPNENPELLSRLQNDPDAAVRFHCDGDVRQAEFWTCLFCSTENVVAQEVCDKCHFNSSWIE